MASAFTHGFVGVMLGMIYPSRKMSARFWILSALCAILPDVDGIGHMLGVEYGGVFGHRGIIHSLLFALVVGMVVPALAFGELGRFSGRWWGLAGYFFVVTASHPLLDAMTTGGLGVAFFSPFDLARYFLPWRFIRVSPIGITSFFSRRGVEVIISELCTVWLPMLLIVGMVMLARRLREREHGGDDAGRSGGGIPP